MATTTNVSELTCEKLIEWLKGCGLDEKTCSAFKGTIRIAIATAQCYRDYTTLCIATAQMS